MGKIKSFDLWMTGFAIQGNSSDARFLGTFEADSFIDACDKWAETLREGDKQYYSKKENKAWFWGCAIYDNETDAKKMMGSD